MAVGVSGQVEHLPTVQLAPGLEALRVAHEPHELHESPALLLERLDILLGRAVNPQVVGHPSLHAELPPGPDALVVVVDALEDRSAGQLGQICRRPDMVGMEMRDRDPLYRRVQAVQRPRPPRPRVGQAEPRVDRRPAAGGGQQVAVDVVDAQRQGEGLAADSTLELDHVRIQLLHSAL